MCKRKEKIAFGSGGDSFYEYTLKEQILDSKGTAHLRELYDAFVYSVINQSNAEERVIYTSKDKKTSLVHIYMGNVAQHLICFGGGLLAPVSYTHLTLPTTERV